MTHWAYDAVFYHIYPLGLCGAPHRNDFQSPVEGRLEQLYDWIPHMRDMGINALYMGPLFESTSHGYDTVDYYHVDRRLGNNETLKYLVKALHEAGIRVILDGVFNHVGRDFWAFRDVLANRQASAYCDWFKGLRFDAPSPHGDPFTYDCWDGHSSLVALNLDNPDVREYLLQAVEMWMRDFDIDGLRLDVADQLDKNFQYALSSFCKTRRADFWLMGEVIHGDYRHWVHEGMLDSVTNYTCYKGLHSSHEEQNYYEVAYELKREYGEAGMYKGLPLYAFADNHDVNRVASELSDPAHLYPLYCILFTMPGVPSIYYGSEWGITGTRSTYSDRDLRPQLDLASIDQHIQEPALKDTITRLTWLRRMTPSLRYGDYKQLHIAHEQFGFMRRTAEQQVVVVLNANEKATSVDLDIPGVRNGHLDDLLNPGQSFDITDGHAHIDPVWPRWARIMEVRT